MVKVGDRIRLSSLKGPDREGVVTGVTGPLVRVRWPSDEETTVVPGPGTLTVLAAGKDAPRKAAKKTAAAKKKAAAKKVAAKKTAGAKGVTAGKSPSPKKKR